MQLEIRHNGRFVMLKALSGPAKIHPGMIAVEDQIGYVCVIALFYSKPAAKILRKNTFLAIKEPYFTLSVDGKILIRVDQMSDLVCLDMDNRFLPVHMSIVPILLFSPSKRQDMADAAFRRGNLQGALKHYTGGLGIKQYDQEIRCTLHLSRARARFNLGHYELAVHDARAAITREDVSGKVKAMNLKAFYQAAQALYELGEYADAKKYFLQGLKMSPQADDFLGQLRRSQERLAEESTGNYDFRAMSKSVTKDCNDHASFVKNTKIAPAGHRGRGLFVAKRFAPGELLIVEKAFYVVSDNDSSGAAIVVDLQGSTPQCYRGRYVERIYGATEKILHNPRQAAKFLDLYDGGNFNKATKFIGSMVTVDT